MGEQALVLLGGREVKLFLQHDLGNPTDPVPSQD